MPEERSEIARLRRALARRGWLTEADARIAVGGPPERAAQLIHAARPRPRRVGALLVDPEQARLAERRLMSALRRMHRENPLTAGFRVDALVARALAVRDRRPGTHRGAGRLQLDAEPLRRLVEDLAARGRLRAEGRRVSLPDHRPELGSEMRRRADRLLDELRAGGATPPRAAAVARRLGLPEAAIEHLRERGELVALSGEIDYPADVYRRLRDVAARLAAERGAPPSVGEYRTAIGSGRRHAAALLERFAAEA